MAIVGLGTDIVEIERIEQALIRSGDRFAARILAPEEMEAFQLLVQKTATVRDSSHQPCSSSTSKNAKRSLSSPQSRFLAKRFAVKEAASKALGTGIADGVTFHDFVVEKNAQGKPLLMLNGRAKALALSLGVSACHVSISDERHYATATVILE